MRTFILLIMAALAGMTCRTQGRKPKGGVRTLTVDQHITPYRIDVSLSKTVRVLFSSEVCYVDLDSTDIIAGKADGVENVMRVKAAVRDFPGETNFSVITGDGSFYSFLVSYKEELGAPNINTDSRFPTGPSTGGSAARMTELGEEDPSIITSLMYTAHHLDCRDVKHTGCHQSGMQALLRGIYVHKDLLFLHISLANSSHVPFDIDFVRSKVVDKKMVKRTVQQETYIEPVRVLNEPRRTRNKREGRIVYVFHKVVILDDRLIEVEIYKKDGGRHQWFHIENSDLVDARLVDKLVREQCHEKVPVYNSVRLPVPPDGRGSRATLSVWADGA